MGKKDSTKSKINVLTAVLVVFLGSLFGLAGYAFANRKSFDNLEAIIISVSGLLLLMVLCYLSFLLKKEIKNLEDMQ